MTRITIVASVLLAFVVVGWTAKAEAQKSKLLTNIAVKSVTATSLVVTSDGKDTTFGVDAKTRIIGKGVGTKIAAKGTSGRLAITDLLAEGDRVTVTYREVGTTLQATTVELVKAATK